jgi:hypothetical protein
MKVTLLQNISYKEKLISDAMICIEVTALKLNKLTLLDCAHSTGPGQGTTTREMNRTT